ncbi:phenoloxidase-activating factor 3-like isoform X2 [Hyalella azteca]|uniref:Phenoloxidase-activating factor 3-like isoform X2 n=1 Tax=Hyalella azteca TaxID=294128 RepID=A0A8B7N3Z4_HYAAZ|nr:phenoloxidase-activating factor 3-like isoform X2 [Hyalella azteca]
MVALGYLDDNQQLKFQCGASLVTRQHVVTAAHCLHPDAIGFQTLKQLNIGEWNTQTDPDCSVSPASGKRVCAPPVVVRQPAAVTWHPQYNNNGKYNNDIAVIRLDKPVTFGAFIQPICIPADFDPKTRTASDVNPLASATGWGKTEKLDSSPVLQEIKLPLVDMQRCNASYAGILNDKQICAGGVKGEDSCEGDSGGPLVTTSKDGDKHLLIGLTSFGGVLCGGHNSYAVYTAVHKYRDWIIQTLAV